MDRSISLIFLHLEKHDNKMMNKGMNMINQLNERFSIVEKERIKSGKTGISEVLAKSPFKLPDDYISFLECISGKAGEGIWLEADGWCPIAIYSAQEALAKMRTYGLYAYDVWIIGDDIGDAAYFYKKDESGTAIYYEPDLGALGAPDHEMEKVADTLTDFLVKGIGIDVMERNL